jgi:hypothetical protein
MVTRLPLTSDHVLGFKLRGKLHDDDYHRFVPFIEAAIRKNGKVRLLAQFEEFEGWDVGAVWEDTKFAVKHSGDVEKIALVGDRAWEKWMAVLCKPFTVATLEYFDATDLDRAWKWLAK